LQAQVLAARDLSWTIGASDHRNHFTITEPYTGVAQPVNPYPRVESREQWNGGLQTALRYKGFFLQGALLARFNEVIEPFLYTAYYKDMLSVSNLLAGYRLSPKGSPFSGLELYLQGRNLPADKNAQVNAYRFAYYGIGLRGTLR
jgi:hypothetical protein